jgi:hypothetical protein
MKHAPSCTIPKHWPCKLKEKSGKTVVGVSSKAEVKELVSFGCIDIHRKCPYLSIGKEISAMVLVAPNTFSD